MSRRPADKPRSCPFFFSSRRRHTRSLCDWSSDVCSSDLHGSAATDARSLIVCSTGSCNACVNEENAGSRPMLRVALEVAFRGFLRRLVRSKSDEDDLAVLLLQLLSSRPGRCSMTSSRMAPGEVLAWNDG